MSRFALAGVLLLGCAVILAFACAAPAYAATSYAGVRSSSAEVAVSFREILAHDAALTTRKEHGTPRAIKRLPVPMPDAARGLAPQKGAAAPKAPVPAAPQPKSLSLADNFQALPDSGTAIPPDTDGAVGASHLMVALNDRVRFQTKAGASLSTVDLLAFWQTGFPSLSDVFDPKVIYDSLSGRFMFVTCAERSAAASSMLLAVSATSDPTGSWNMYQLDGDASDTNWVDYPNIGVNGKWITITSNMFTIAGDTFAGANVWVINKTDALAGATVTFNLFFETGIGGVLVPCTTFSAAETTQYLIQTFNGAAGLLRLYTVTGPVATPVFTDTGLSPTATAWSDTPTPAPQLGSVNTIDSGDDRVINAVLRNGSLWCTHAVGLPSGAPTRSAVKWWQVNPVSGAAIQSGVVEDTVTGSFYYYPSISVNANDEVLMGFSGSSSTTFVSAYYTTRVSSDASGTMQPVSLLKAGLASYFKTFSGTSNRWGDYSSTCVDPADDLTMWTIQEYADSPADTWGTWWGKLSSAAPPTVDFSSATYSIGESGGTATITVNLSAAPGTGNTATVQFSTSNGSATEPADYTSASGTLTFGATDTSMSFTAPVASDGLHESDETVVLTLSSPVGCTLAGTNNPATLTIVDDDPDSDADGITDADEVAGTLGYVTNPINADTDGDGVDDLIEIQGGADPTNPASMPRLSALSVPFFK
ncbi:MAG: hypothetical protein HZB26_25230 [Candidatus Hydrogenedentes bacterium]|nr:hypothetical protein [Candidatus Hydrogenedentota bacterium]